jgi:lysosomal Pro-X carboxypeptidase
MRICPNSSLNSTADLMLLEDFVENTLFNIGMYNYPYDNNYSKNLIGEPLKHIASYFANLTLQSSTEDLLWALLRSI